MRHRSFTVTLDIQLDEAIPAEDLALHVRDAIDQFPRARCDWSYRAVDSDTSPSFFAPVVGRA